MSRITKLLLHAKSLWWFVRHGLYTAWLLWHHGLIDSLWQSIAIEWVIAFSQLSDWDPPEEDPA